ncbi:non-ribosomal peptide synthase/polyketide synthase [Pseudomonas mendocina]|nr:non-ribosomal peptide synthase/polyketide synthase [Pseudomonas mendocina]MBH3339923.1 non-ribosomal peptide synthase/polyketide synthase [Pseudomonas mendocina]
MNAQQSLMLARRFIELPLEKRRLFLEGLREEGVDFSLLPIPAGVAAEDRDAPSYAQRRMWFLWQLEPQSGAYNLPCAVRLRGGLDEVALQRAFTDLVARHETLRTVFRRQDDDSLYLALLVDEVRIEREDLSALEVTVREVRVREEAEQQSWLPFDLEQGPLLRVRLLRLADDEHVLLLTLHHIVADGWSMNLLVDELARLYDGHALGAPAELPALPIQYADYALWQRRWLEAGEQERQLDYWRAHLGEEHTPLALPADRPRPAVASHRGTRHEFAIDAELAEGLRGLARAHGISLFMLLLGVFGILLQRYSGQADIRVGVPIANRTRSETEGLIGFFVNTQVLRLRLDGRLGLDEYLQHIREITLGAQDHQELPFERLVEAFNLERSLSHNPLFQVMYNHQPQVADITALQTAAGLTFSQIDWRSRTTQFDLTLDTYERGGKLQAALTYADDLFDADTIERMARHLNNLWRAIVADPRQRIADLPMLDEDERLRIVHDWNATAADYPLECPVHRLIEAQAERSPQAPALVFAGRTLDYAQLNAHANRLAHKLIELGVGPDVLVGIAVERSIEMVVGLLAILKAGGAYVPLDPEYPSERLAYMLDDSGVRLLLSQSHLELPLAEGLQRIDLDQDDDWLEGYAESNPDVALESENLAYVIYTSGSTGKPKGAGNRHSALTNRLCWMQQAYGLDASDTVLQKTPFSFDVSVWEFFWPLMTGARLVVAAPGDHRDPAKLVEVIDREGVTTLHFVPSMLQAFLQDDKVSTCTCLKRIVCSGEALPVDAQQQVFARLPQASLYNLYGPTEAAIDVTHWTCMEEGKDAVPIGQPIANLACHILDGDLQPVPAGVLGELYLAGAGLARGYHQRPSLTAERFVASPFVAGERMYRTGDLARYRADGVIEYAGRIDHQVKLRGLRIELGEIEARLLEHERVREVAVLAVDGKQLVGYVVLADAADGWREALAEHLGRSLPDYMVPTQWISLERMPLSPNGKLERKALPRPDADAAQNAYAAPQGELEQRIAAIWQDVLGRERVGRNDNFFELGGDSIVSIQVVSRARQAGIQFTPKDLFRYQTVRSLAAVAEVGSEIRIDQGAVTGEVALTPVQRWFFEQDIARPQHWNQSLLLEPRAPLDAAQLEAAVARLIEQHDALRLRFEVSAQGWQQDHAALPLEAPVWHRRVASAEALESICDEAQRSLDLSQGPMLRVVLVDMPDGSQRLLLAIHHLVVDGVSWRILLEDLQSLLTQAETGSAFALPAKTSSYQAWAARLQGHAGDGVLAGELDYWRQALTDAPVDLPCDNPEGGLRNAQERKVTLTLDAELTRQLLQEAPGAYRTQVGDLLLTALARVVTRWSGGESALIQLEGHGREELFEDIDLTRTVGWFTSMFPVRLTPQSDLPGSIKTIKEQLRAVPSKGLGFAVLRYLGDADVRAELAALPQPRITFNYLGQFDGQFDQQALFVPAAESPGQAQDEQAPLANWLSIEGQVYGGELSLQWSFSQEMFAEATVRRLVEDYRQELAALIAHCVQSESGGATPSDFPLVSLTQARLDALPIPLAQIEDIYPLSSMQQGLLMHTLLEPNSGIYFMQDRYCIDSDIDLPRFRSAWQEVIQRHDALRASFDLDQHGDMLQIIHRHAPLRLDYLDWSARALDQHEADLQRLLEQERQQGFDLLVRPPFSLRLIRRAPQQYWFILSNHHILIDAWCRSLLLQDFFTLYQGKPITPPAARYRDFIAWLQEQGEEAAIQAWREELQGVEQPTWLPYDRPPQRQGGQSQIGDRYLQLPRSEGRALRELAQRYQLTVNTFTQAAWALVMQRYSGDSDVLFGVTVAGRPVSRPEMQDIVGLFINSIPLRVRMPKTGSVRQWLQALFEHNLALREHEHLPLLKIQACSAIDGNQQLFDSLFVFENAPLESSVVSGAEALSAIADSARTHTNYPLTVVIYPGDELGLHLSYDQRFFDEATVDRLLRDMKVALDALVSGFHGEFTALQLMSEDDRYQLLEACNRTVRSYPLEQGYVRLFEASVARYAERTAASCLGQSWSYAELNRLANRAGHALIAAGAQVDQPVALLAERDLPLLGMIVGSFKAGAGYLPLDPHLPDERLLRLLELSRAPVLFCSRDCVARARQLLDSLAAADAPRLLVWEGVQAGDGPQHDPQIYVGARHLAYVIYTSGSTGTPKGVLVEQGGMLNNQLSKVPYLGLDEHDVIAQTASQSFDISVWQFLTAALCGARVDIVPQVIAQEPAALLAHVREAGISVLESVPSLIQGLLDEPQAALGSLRWLLPTGEAMPPELARRWLQRYPQIGLVNAYGPAECSDDVALYRVEMDTTQGACLPIGSPTDNNRLYLLDGDLLPVPVGAVGELYVAGTGVGRGYLGDPARTAVAYLPDPFAAEAGGRLYRSGDLGRRRNDGLLEYVGRGDHQVKVRGFRIELGEIAAHLLELDGVRDAAVDIYDSATGKALVGYVVPASAELSPETLRDRLREGLLQRLPDYMVPQQWLFLDALPLTPNGKLDRKALPKPDTSQSQRAFVAPGSELEQRIAGIWQDVLKLERVGLNDDFFELGGHSLLATQVVSRVRHALNIDLPLRSLFEHTTLQAFVQTLGQGAAGDEPAMLPVDRGQPLPLSYAQERQWFLWQLQPDSAAYNIPLALRLRGSLDVPALERSFNALIERHESLRTRFVQQDRQALQIIDTHAALTLRVEPLADESLIADAVQTEAQEPFDLQQGPLLRVKLLQLAADDHLLLLTQHHIISDGWSMQVVVEELIELYGAYGQGKVAQLPAMPIQYADYAQWQRQWMAVGEEQRQLAYWRDRLGGEQPLLELPTDRPRPAVQDHRGARLDIALDSELSSALRQLAQREGATLFMLLLASFQALLHRYSGQRDIRVGVPVAGRNRMETERLLGLFVNTQVLKAEVDGQASFVELLGQVKQAAIEAQAHQDLPFERLVEALQPQRSLSHSPLFQVMYNHLSELRGKVRHLPELMVEELQWESRAAQFDLALDTFESGNVLHGTLVYATSVFDRSTIERLAAHWRNLLEAICVQPKQRICELSLLGEAEREFILGNGRQSQANYFADRHVHQLIEEQAGRSPQALAVICGDQRLNFRQLDTQANQLAHRLIEMGVGPEIRVAVAMRRSAHTLVAFLAVLKAGGAYVPLDASYPSDRLRFMLQDCVAALVLSQSDLLDRLPIIDGLPVLAVDRADTWRDYPEAAPDVSLEGENLAYVIYTSGSTGQPKGVEVSHGPLAMHCQAIGERYEMSAADCELQFMSLAFDGAHERWLTALSHGARLLLRDDDLWTPEQTYQEMHRHAVSITALPPAYLQQLAEHAEREGNPPPVRIYCFGGDAVPQASYELAWKTLRPQYLFNGYGPTETVVTPLLWKAHPGDACGSSYAPIGTLVGGRCAYVLDSDLSLLPVGLAGELYLGGCGVARGYHGRPGLTAERFVPDPFGEEGGRVYRSGDLTRARPNGLMDYLGRIDHQVKIRGFRIELGEIEARLQGHPAIRDAVVVDMDGPSGKQLVGYLVLVPEQAVLTTQQDLSRGGLREWLKAGLPDYMVPAHLIFLDSLPLTPNGKLDRKALPGPDASLQQQAYIAPRTELERQVAAIWAEVLKLDRGVGLSDNFFELGGHSLLAIQVISRVRQSLDIELPLRELFEAPSLAVFVERIGRGVGNGAPPFAVIDRGQPLLLSYAQQRQWFLWQLEPQSAAYHIPTALRLKGELNVEALRRSFAALIQRHESLRTTFRQEDGQVVQIIHPQLLVELPVEVLEGLGEQALKVRIEMETQRPFELENGPLLRMKLLRLAADEHVLVLTLHHIVTDGWSTPIMVEELVRFYEGYSKGQELQLPTLPIQYADYSVWQRTWMEGGERERQLEYWQAQLGDEQPVLELPTDYPRPAVQSNAGARLDFELGADLSRSLRQLAQARGVTLFMLLLASFQALLHRYSGQADIRVGVPIANRHWVETERLIGFFVNTQVLKAEFFPQTTFDELLQQVKVAALGAQAHQDLPFEQLVEALQPERSLSHSPLFQVMFNHQIAAKGGARQLSDLAFEELSWESRTAQFDLALDTFECDDAIMASLTYATDLFERSTVERMVGHWRNLLGAIVQQTERCIADLSMLETDEQQRIVHGWNRTRIDYPQDRCVHQLIEDQVIKTPEAIALIAGDQALSYLQLNRRANKLAHKLRELGVGPEVLVGIAAERSLEMVVGLLAILKAGGAYVPLDPGYPSQRLAYLLEDSGLHLLLAQPSLRERLPVPDALPCLALEPGDDWLQGYDTANLQGETCPENLAYVIYTSGSTGQPKGVAIRRAAMLNHMQWMQETLGLGAQDRVLQKTAFSFDASVWEFWLPLMNGAQLHLAAPDLQQDLARLWEEVQQRRITVLQLVPSLLNAALPLATRERMLSLRLLCCGGEALGGALVRQLSQFWDGTLVNLYGPTETTIDACACSFTPTGEYRTSSIGRPIANVRTHVLHHDGVCPVGSVGELFIAGHSLARGYHRRPALTAERFIPDPFDTSVDGGGRLYRSGDLARYRGDGTLDYVGRIDHQVKIRGLRIELGEIEERLQQQDDVREAVVLVLEGTAGQQLVGYVVPSQALPSEGQEALRERLKAALRAYLPEYMVPTLLIFLERLPLSPNGKLLRKALPRPEAGLSQTYLEPQGEVEQRVAALWAEVLKVERVGRHDNFFELGGHSLLATQVMVHVREQLGIEMALKELFEFPALADFSLAIQRKIAHGEPFQNELAKSLEALKRLNTEEIEKLIS